MIQWQPYAANGAPRDGKPVLLWRCRQDQVLPADDGPVVAYWSESGWWLSADGETAYPERFISHWSLIDPPEATA